MKKLTNTDVLNRFEAVIAILGEEDCEDAQLDLRMKFVRGIFLQASQNPVINLAEIANDAGSQ